MTSSHHKGKRKVDNIVEADEELEYIDDELIVDDDLGTNDEE